MNPVVANGLVKLGIKAHAHRKNFSDGCRSILVCIKSELPDRFHRVSFFTGLPVVITSLAYLQAKGPQTAGVLPCAGA